MSITRREALRRIGRTSLGGASLSFLFGGAALADSIGFSDSASSSPAGLSNPVEIKMRTSSDRTAVWYDPVGLFIEPGQTVRWAIEE